MKFAAIDIGSNGARLLISRVLVKNSAETGYQDTITFKDVEYTRFALELGKDVFNKKKIGEKKKTQLLKLMQAFRLLIELHEVEDYMAMATSAFREAENGLEMVEFLKQNAGVAIEIIDGATEAEILNMAILKYLDKDKNYLHIDVGGGSTELNLYIQCEKIASQSFPIGSIRNTDLIENQHTLANIQAWIKDKLKNTVLKKKLIAVGTGGNINKVLKIINPTRQIIRIEEIQEVLHYLEHFSFMEKVHVLQLNPDRALTIEPAIKIYLAAMEWSGARQMFVPEVGLKDGMMEVMLKRNVHKKISDKEEREFLD